MTQHLLIAHGSPDPRHRETMQLVAKALDARGPRCQVAFIDHDEPRVERWLAGREAGASVVALGMLLAPGYHATVDVPRLIADAASTLTVVDRGPLGTGPWLNRTLDGLVQDVAGSPESPVVLAVAGSTRPEARQSVAAFAEQWSLTRSGPVHVAAATGPGASLHDVVAALVTDRADGAAVVLPLMIAPGVLADGARAVATRHGLRTTGALAESPHFVDAVAQRLAN